MTIFAIYCVDKPNSLELRMATREAHLAYVGGFRDQLRLGGPMLNENGDMAGSIIMVEMETLAEAQALAAGDPYNQAGLFERVDITAFRPSLGKLG
ncbi:MAG: YciI family protein [Pseudomonadota bacterium]|uniref:YciI family protein n=1 Tax=Phenylobacterium sp. TaxID=1871053 RepID=UPI002720C6F8|nr:YciI family protein [Phenylobacterium sp.]MDO9431739.1 YciI family protein [Phenylobacterium sp.]